MLDRNVFFSFPTPARPSPAAPRLEARLRRAKHCALDGVRVLIADQDASAALKLTASLAAAGAIVLGPAGTLAEARALVRKFRPALAILDAAFPDGGAAPVANDLCKRGVPTIIYTGAHPSQALSCCRPGFVLIFKPANDGELLEAAAAMI